MRKLLFLILLATLIGDLAGSHTAAGDPTKLFAGKIREDSLQGTLQANSLCARNEQILFSCAVKRSEKLVSLCASRELAKDRGYLQYRFGLPGKVELAFPKDRKGTQQQFHYSHYFRFQVDRTEINFQLNGYEYSIFDDYNGEEKPVTSEQGVSVSSAEKSKDVRFVCRSKAKAVFGDLENILPNESN
jgi:hypothetical protein